MNNQQRAEKKRFINGLLLLRPHFLCEVGMAGREAEVLWCGENHKGLVSLVLPFASQETTLSLGFFNYKIRAILVSFQGYWEEE